VEFLATLLGWTFRHSKLNRSTPDGPVTPLSEDNLPQRHFRRAPGRQRAVGESTFRTFFRSPILIATMPAATSSSYGLSEGSLSSGKNLPLETAERRRTSVK
jgi:hypothetical protein